jgi:hypothetical protein
VNKNRLEFGPGATYYALSEVTDLRFELEGAEFLTNAYVVEAKDFDMAMGWNFIKEYTDAISACKMMLRLWLDDNIIEVLLEDGMPPPKPKFAELKRWKSPSLRSQDATGHNDNTATTSERRLSRDRTHLLAIFTMGRLATQRLVPKVALQETHRSRGSLPSRGR